MSMAYYVAASSGAHDIVSLGLAITIYIRCMYGKFGREITKYTVIYGSFTVLANLT